jgi:hypothetical protein
MNSTANKGSVRAIFFGAAVTNREAARLTRLNVDEHSESSIRGAAIIQSAIDVTLRLAVSDVLKTVWAAHIVPAN